ncbi:hypothetical protein IW147_002175 [Coemansia sp. RSA 720]|nr:hypothetical protein IW147_002175 [Coemansia sp. RSA 720]
MRLNFLIAHYLSQGALREAAEPLRRLMEQKPMMLPARIDWQGQRHRSDYEALARSHPHVSTHELLRVMQARISGDTSLITAGGTVLGRTWRRPSDSVRNALTTKLRRRQGATHVQQLPLTMAGGMYQRLVRCHGHKYPTFCVLFDRTGRRMITGSDDYLVKVWCTRTGYLINTLKGHQDVVTDIALNTENTLLASASADGTVRVWNVRTGEPRTVLVAHAQGRAKGITGVKFSPAAREELRFVATACDDGLCRLYRWSRSRLTVDAEPIVVDGRSQSRDAVSSFAFNHTGSRFAVATTGGFVSIYSMLADTLGAPRLVARMAAHEESITTLVFSADGAMLLTGSIDGTARVWTCSGGMRWDAVTFDIKEPSPVAEMPAPEPNENLEGPTEPNQNAEGQTESNQTLAEPNQNQEASGPRPTPPVKRVETNQVAWACDGTRVLISNNIGTVAAFDPHTGRECWRRRGAHGTSEVYVLITHPYDARVAVSGGYDGRALVWDVDTGTTLREFHVGEQLFDGTFSEDGRQFALTGDTGAATLFGLGAAWAYEDAAQMPEQMFDSDYTATIMDANRFVADQQTQMPAYLVPHSALMDFDGRVYRVQRGARFGMGIEMGVDARRFAREDDARRAALDAELANAHMDCQAALHPFIAEAVRPARPRVRVSRAQPPQRTEPAEELLPLLPIPIIDDDSDDEEYSAGLDEEDEDDDEPMLGSGGEDVGYTVDEDRVSAALNDARNRSIEMEMLRSRHRRSSVSARLATVGVDSDTLRRSLRSRSNNSNGRNTGIRRGRGRPRRGSPSHESEHDAVSSDGDFQPQTRGGRQRQQRQQQQQRQPQPRQVRQRRITSDTESDESDSVSGGMAQVDIASEPDVNIDAVSETESDTGAASLVADTSPPPDTGLISDASSEASRRRSGASNGVRSRVINFTSDEDESSSESTHQEDHAVTSSSRLQRRGEPMQVPRGDSRLSNSNGGEFGASVDSVGRGKQPAQANDQNYVPTDWVMATRPSTVPYRPQVGDLVVYFREGHLDFWNSPARCQKLDAKLLPYVAMPSLPVAVYGKVTGLEYKVGPPTFCNLKIQLLQEQSVDDLDAEVEHVVTRRAIHVQYHDCEGVPDFIVLYSRYRASLQQSLAIGNQVSVLFDDDQAHAAEISGFRDIKPTSRSANVSRQLARNPWKSITVAWTQTEGSAERAEEMVSPWELVHDSHEERDELPSQLSRSLLAFVEELSDNPDFAWFVDNVDYVNEYPDYLLSIAYPMCLDTVRKRLESGFYRHEAAVLFDVALIQENANIFNVPGTAVPVAAQKLVSQFQRVATSGEQDVVSRKRKPVTPVVRRSTRRRRVETDEESSDAQFVQNDNDEDDPEFDNDDDDDDDFEE